MLFQTATVNEFVYLLDEYWNKAYFGGFSSNNYESLKKRIVDIPKEINYQGITYEVVEILESALICSYFLTSIKIPDSIKRIGDYAFHRCYEHLKDIVLPKSLLSIGEHAFDGCSSLESITIPNNISEISNSCFYGCDNLSNVVLPDKLFKIGAFAFYACKNLSNIVIPNSVIEIGDGAFAFCEKLTSFTLPKNLQFLHVNVFLQNSQITKIISLNPVPPHITRGSFDKYEINHYFKTASLYVPNQSISLYKQSEDWGCFSSIIGI